MEMTMTMTAMTTTMTTMTTTMMTMMTTQWQVQKYWLILTLPKLSVSDYPFYDYSIAKI
jgi:hypothetical protein